MNISILSVFPELFTPFLSTSLVARAQERGVVQFDLQDYFSFSESKERIDAPTFGPGAGMVLKPDVVQKAIEQQEGKHGKAFRIFFTPQGKKLDQPLLRKLSADLVGKHVMLVTSRYEGMDARVEKEYADLELSIGDYVLLGGDLPAMVFLESFLRLLPDVVGKLESVEAESFSNAFVDHPVYGPPVNWKGYGVPEIVRSGNHEKIRQWRQDQAARKSVFHHFDWVRSHAQTKEERTVASKHIPPHYCALMHDEINLPQDRIGTTSVTSLDIHDIARSARTYGMKQYTIVTPLADQKKLVETLTNFWKSDVGIGYNPQRHEAVQHVQLRSSLDEVIAMIEQKEGVKPLVIATSARSVASVPSLNFHDQDQVFGQERPVLLLFGTGQGLADSVFDRCDYMLLPVEGFSDYNHLSVRSAAAIVFDRWLGINLKKD